MLETSLIESPHNGQMTLSTLLIKPNISDFTLVFQNVARFGNERAIKFLHSARAFY